MAQNEPKEFVQPLPGFNEVLQYGRDVRLVIDSYDSAFACPMAEELGLDETKWIRIEGRRGPEERLIGLTTVIIRRDCIPPRALLENSETSLGDLIEQSTGIVVGRIDQEISAVTIQRGAARILKSTTGASALRARRLYYEKNGDLFLATESIHPADRFSYRLTFTRNGADEA
jgi:DNA-binding GntR family transcriptional regulator